MMLIVYYLVLVLIGDALAIMLSLWIERSWPLLSLPIFLALYFSVLAVAWIAAVRLSEPKPKVARAGTPLQEPPQQ
jgi:hypothetical protein